MTANNHNRSYVRHKSGLNPKDALISLAFAILMPFSSAVVSQTDYPDNPEPGLQGETMPGEAKLLSRPYSAGVRLIGQTDIEGGAIMAWGDHCAYIPGRTNGITVIDVEDPATPRAVKQLKDKGAMRAGETTHAVWTSERKLLAASVYGVAGPNFGGPGMSGEDDAWVAVYDISDCTNPRLVLEFKWPGRVHTLRVSPNGKRIYGTVISPFTGEGGIQVMDISDFENPRFIGKFQATRADGTSYEFATHELSLSPDETRIYAGVIASKGDDLNKGIKIFPPNAEGLGPEAGGIYIFDNSDIAQGKLEPKMRLIGTAQHAGWHEAIPANINGIPYLVGSGELLPCPGSWPRITNIADEANPRVVSHFRLEMNRKENCPTGGNEGDKGNGVTSTPGTATIHWSDVDDPDDTRLAMFTYTWAGLRLVDIRDPENPQEVAYFKPGDSCMTHTRYVRETGHIWFGCASQFYVIELKPDLRESLGLNSRDGA